MKQSMSGREAQRRIDAEAAKYARLFQDGTKTLEDAHKHLCTVVASASLFRIAGIAKAIACFQCTADDEPQSDVAAAAGGLTQTAIER